MIRLVLAALVLGGCQYVFPLAQPGDAGTDGSQRGGQLDETFAARGWRTITLLHTSGEAIAVAPDGTATAVGFSSEQGVETCVVLQLDRDGVPAGFGSSGEVVITYNDSCLASGVALYEGNVILAGVVEDAAVLAARLLPDGQRDTSFANDGTVALNLGEMDYADDVAVGPEGILLVGGEGAAGGNAGAMLTARLRQDGTLDPTWNGTGVAIPIEVAETAAISLDAQPSILIAGTTDHYAAVVRMLETGDPDGSFGSAGIKLVGDNVMPNYAFGLVQRADGGMIVGIRRDVGASTETHLVALERTGMPDKDFNVAAPLAIDFGTSAKVSQLALQPDGKVIVAATLEYADHKEIGLARVTTAGALDDTFGDGGIVRSRPEASSSFDVGDVAFAGDRIVITGAETRLDGIPFLYIARFMP